MHACMHAYITLLGCVLAGHLLVIFALTFWLSMIFIILGLNAKSFGGVQKAVKIT